MIKLPFEKLYKKFMCELLAFIVITMNVGLGLLPSSAAGSPTISVQIASAQNGAVSMESGTQGTALVFLDCSDYVFKNGAVKISFDSSVFDKVVAKSDADIVSKTELSGSITSVQYSFDSAAGIKGTIQLGTVSFELKDIKVDAVKSDIKISEIKFIDNKGNTHTQGFAVKGITVTVENKNIMSSILPSATAGLQNPTETPDATGEGSLLPGETPKPTNQTEILTDTAMYTLEDVEDLSRGAVVFWGILFMIAGIWIGLGLGYWIWCKRKGKPQVKDPHSNVIGHL